MTYIAGGNIQATDYNTFANKINEIYSDLHAGQIGTSGAQYGYGAAANLPLVAIGNDVTAAQWTGLLSRVSLCAIHQNTPSSLPVSVNIGDTIFALSTLTSTINNLFANSLVLSSDPIQRATIVVNDSSSTPWTAQRTFSWSVDFATWDNARHFFNSGGSLTIAGTYTGGSNPPIDNFWSSIMLGNMGTVGLRAMDLNPITLSPTIPVYTGGFYNLTNAFQEVWRKAPTGGAYYSGSFISIQAKTNASPGTNGLVDFRIILHDGDTTPDPKTGTLTFTHGYIKSAGAIPYVPAISLPAGTFS